MWTKTEKRGKKEKTERSRDRGRGEKGSKTDGTGVRGGEDSGVRESDRRSGDVVRDQGSFSPKNDTRVVYGPGGEGGGREGRRRRVKTPVSSVGVGTGVCTTPLPCRPESYTSLHPDGKGRRLPVSSRPSTYKRKKDGKYKETLPNTQ